ncbi:Ribosomal protein [Trema orientale]|uniref:Ribosomal protein n=1 Tax=Trema orientale TaxID=63057 RepID=A0A2P5F9Q3_TREOI|nr:Ribosomal protein [Trema orientale]
MPCSKEEALVRLFYNVSSSFQLFLLFFSLSFIFLYKFFHFVGSNPIFPRSQNGYEYMFSDEEEDQDEEEEEEEEEERSLDDHRSEYHRAAIENDHLVADIICGGEALHFLPNGVGFDRRGVVNDDQNLSAEEFISPQESLAEDDHDIDETHHHQDENDATELLSMHDTDTDSDDHDHGNDREKIPPRDTDRSIRNAVSNNEHWPTSPIVNIDLRNDVMSKGNDKICHDYGYDQNIESKVDTNFSGDENFLTFGPTQLQPTKKLQVKEKDIIHDHEEVYGDSCTVGSTSKSSSEWRSSINYRDSGTDDPFSSSSRRSCPKWESYTVFQKYDEEMMFLDRISAQKLHETESLRSIKVSPRSVSDRIVHKFSTLSKTPNDIRRNPYHELEAAYVAQICLTWEALNWNYKKFQEKRASRRDSDPGCPGQIAQQFQQFQVLLQRYVENEPYEHGRRPEIYARMRLLAPKLLQVPEYRDSLDDQRDDQGLGSRISSPAFLIIMEDCIHTFMNFLKADKENPCQIITALFKRKRRGSVDPTLLHLIKKVNQKKKTKLKDLRRARKCLRKRRLKVDEGMEIVMGLIDLKVVCRVLRMKELSEEQMHWCEEKMSKVRILDGKLQRDSSPLFFPAH